MLRPYQASDLPALTRFIGECLQGDKLKNYHPGDFVHWMSNGYRGERLKHHFQVVEEGQLLAVVELAADGAYAPVIATHRRGGAWELAFHRACIAALRKRTEHTQTAITVNFTQDDKAGQGCLEQLGFKAQKVAHAVMKCSLGTLYEPRLPAGFTLRPVAGEHEAQLVAEVHNGAFGSDWSGAEYLKVMRTPGFDPNRELVVVAPDGRFAAFVVVWFDPISRTGLFEPVGCHRDFRRRGLTKALMFAGMARMKEAGMETALVGYESTNEAASKLYKSAGFELCFETIDYVLELDHS